MGGYSRVVLVYPYGFYSNASYMYIGSWYFDDVPSFGESEGCCFSISAQGLGRTLILRLHDQ